MKKGRAAGKKSGFRLWKQYFWEKRAGIFLYFGTVLLFMVTGCLYHLENVPKLLYAALLTLVLWAGAGIAQGLRYVRKRRELETVEKQFEQAGELRLEEIREGAETEDDGTPRTVEQQLVGLLTLVDESRSREHIRREEKEADRRDYFLMWAHQIKTPIAAMKLLLEEAGDGRNNFQMREELFKIEQYAEMVLTFQRLESMAADLVLQEYDLAPLLRQAVRKYSILFINKGLQVEVPDTECRVLTDEKWFSFCLEQLLSNSIKYTAEGSIRFLTEKRERNVLLTLADTGIGIREEDLPRIYEKGFTGYTGRLDKRATGVGLYLCSRIFQRLGIEVEVKSRVGQGTRVLMTVPVSYKNVSLEKEM